MIVFQNNGLIDVAAITTMGISVKEGDSPIGRFGTGVKFAIATLLRHDCAITIYRGHEPLVFSANEIEVRGETFHQVCMNGTPLGFTTMLGRDWEPWMAYRELASNCRDEGGEYWKGTEPPTDAEMTTITVAGEAIMEVWPNRQSIMLEGDPVKANDHIEIRDGSSLYIFYRGVRIANAPRHMSKTYNVLTPLTLTEDRTAKNWYEVEFALERGIGALDDRSMLREIMTVSEVYGEHHMDIPRFGEPKETFRDVARELALGHANEPNANPKAVAYARAAAIKDMQEGDSVELDAVQTMMLNKAKRMLESGGFAISEFPLIVCETLGPSIHGMAKDGKIFLSLMPFAKGTREVAATLLEEFAHLKSGQDDCTRGFQNWLFDQLLIRSERAAGEPF